MKNNIVWNNAGGHPVEGSPDPSAWSFSHNMFDSDPGFPWNINAVISSPDLMKVSGWLSLTEGSVTGEEFSLQSGSRAIDQGMPVSGYSERITASDFTSSPILVATTVDDVPEMGAWAYVTAHDEVPPVIVSVSPSGVIGCEQSQ
jgi:hypothetical protein